MGTGVTKWLWRLGVMQVVNLNPRPQKPPYRSSFTAARNILTQPFSPQTPISGFSSSYRKDSHA